ncbi:hypothetical protein EI200_19710 [Peribacillus simplex]|uniref:hypothetical protein n=1 Tax=Peribacillus simplex TaxID=1478 RepID=UPI000F62D43E|nr:hypothetical protein [Peribacillus simplex]RRN68446.1 hypothetical protein EI200_19710 [Peribacillus simplex]
MKILTNAFFTIAVLLFFTALTLSFIILQIIINRHIVIDKNNVDIFDLLLKASFALIGSSLSGFTALLVFFLGDRKKEKEKVENETKLLSKIKEEASINLNIFKQILNVVSETKIEELAEIIHLENSKVKEGLMIFYTRLDFSLFEASVKDLNEKSYLDNISYWRKQKTIYDYLKLLLTNIQNKDNSITLLRLIRDEIISLTKD